MSRRQQGARDSRRSPGGAVAAPFLPTRLSGCVLWLRADLGITLNGSNVSAWADQSGVGNNATQSTGANQPAFTASAINGRPGLTVANFSAQSMSLPNAFGGLTTAAELFVVAMNATSSQPGLSHFGGGGGNWYPFSDAAIYEDFGQSQRPSHAAPSGLTSPHLYNVIASTTEFTWLVNGTQFFTTAGSAMSWNATPVICNGGASGSYAGIVCEYIIYSRKLSTSERTQVKSYAASRYGITIA